MYSAQPDSQAKCFENTRRYSEDNLYKTPVFVEQSEYNIRSVLEKVKSEPILQEKKKVINMYQWDQAIDFIDDDENILVEDMKPKATPPDLRPILDMSSSFHQTEVLKPITKQNLLNKSLIPDNVEKNERFDDTIMDSTLDWRQQVSDDSFVQMEKLMSEVKENDNENEPEKVVVRRENSIDALLKTELPPIQESFDSSQNSTAPKSSSFDDSLNFNDTLEEMEHLMKYGLEYILKNPTQEVVVEKPSIEQDTDPYLVPDNNISDPIKPIIESKSSVYRVSNLKSNPSTRVIKNSPAYKSPCTTNLYLNKGAKVLNINLKPAINTTPFKVPGKQTPSSVEKRVFFPTPPSAKNKTPSQYDNVLSPVQYYIKNSPVVPKIKNVSPGKNFWMREYERSVSKAGSMPAAKGKENSTLQQKAYKASTSTKLVATPPSHRLPKNSRVGLMAESLPKPTVIKHKRREFFPSPPIKDTKLDCAASIEDSFANLKMHVGDVSVCVKKDAVRSHTLK